MHPLPFGARRTAFVLFLGVCLLYLAIARGVVTGGDDTELFLLTQDIAARGDVQRAPDDTTEGVGLPLVAVPSYWLADVVLDPLLSLRTRDDASGNPRLDERIYGTALINAPIGGATVSLTYLLALALGYRRATALIIALLLATGTTLAHYSALFLPEPLLALTLTLCVYGIIPARIGDGADGGRDPWLLLSGFAAGLAFATRPEMIVALLPGVAWLSWHLVRALRSEVLSPRAGIRAALCWGAPVAAWLAVVGWFNWERFGSVLDFGSMQRPSLVETSLFEGVYGLLLSPGRGVVWYNPPLLLGLLGCGLFIARRPTLGLTISAMLVATVGYYAAGDAWHGGAVWGARYLVPLLPLLMLAVGEVIEPIWNAAERNARRVIAGLVVIVAVAGLAVTTLGVVVPFDRVAAEPSESPAAFHDALFTLADAPLVEHAERFGDAIDTPDLAARRYDSTLLWVVAALALLFAALCLVQVTRWTIRPPLPPVPVVRQPPPGWDDVPRC